MSIWAVAEDHGKWEPPEEFGYYTDESLAKKVLEKLQGSPHRKYYIYPIKVNEYIDLLDKNLYRVNVISSETSISKLHFGLISGTKLKQVVDPGCRGVESRYCYVMAKDESEALAQGLELINKFNEDQS